MPWRPSTSVSRTCRPPAARARASDAATVVLPVPPLPVTTWSFTEGKSLTLARVVVSGSPQTRPGPPAGGGRGATNTPSKQVARPPGGQPHVRRHDVACTRGVPGRERGLLLRAEPLRAQAGEGLP